VKATLTALVICLCAALLDAGAQAQEYPLPRAPEACLKRTPRMSLTLASFDRFRRTTSIYAPISKLASGMAHVDLHGGGRITQFDLPIESARGRIRGTRGIDAAQARAATAILTLTYAGDGDTRPQILRLRAALHAARLTSTRPALTSTGVLQAKGTISRRARGAVRVQLEWVNRSDGSSGTVERLTPIRAGRWQVNAQLPPEVLTQIDSRCSDVQAVVVFTGYQPLLMRGEVRSLRVLREP
jgi:hypothetical protein